MTLIERENIIIYLKNNKHERQIRKFGHIVHTNNKDKWVSMYVNKDKLDETLAQFEKLKYIVRVEVSPYQHLKVDYSDK